MPHHPQHTTTVRFPIEDDLKASLGAQCERTGETRSEAVAQILDELVPETDD